MVVVRLSPYMSPLLLSAHISPIYLGASFPNRRPPLYVCPSPFPLRSSLPFLSVSCALSDRLAVSLGRQVSVRALPRCDTVPTIPCAACQAGEAEQTLGACAAPLPPPAAGPGPAFGPAAGPDGATDQW